MAQDEVVVITGGGRGVGARLASTLGAAGWRVVLGARSEREMAAVASEIRAAGGVAESLVTDVTSAEQVQALVDLAVDRFGRVDAVVANAGHAVNASIAEGVLDDWNRMIDVNLRGVLHAMAAAVPVLRRQGAGHFLAVGSTSASKWVPEQGVYAASKAGVRAATEVLRQELAPEGIRVSLVTPGFIDTGFIDSTRDEARLAALQARRDEIALPPQAVADAIVWVLSQPAGVDVGEVVIRSTAQA